MRFLVVDDSWTMRRILINCLRRLGHGDFVEASNFEMALEAFSGTIDCVITDWNMAGKSGLDLVREIRRTSQGRTVPILMVTGRNSRSDILVALEAGITDYVTKPFTTDTIREKLISLAAGVSPGPSSGPSVAGP